MKRSRWPGRKQCQGLYEHILNANQGDVNATHMYLFNNLGTGEFTLYLLGHVYGYLGSWWECFAKKWFPCYYVLREVRIIYWSVSLFMMIFKSTLYFLDIVKDFRFLILILIPLLPASMPLNVFAFTSIILTEGTKMIQVYFLQRKRSPLYSPVMPFLLHHDEFMEEIELHHLALLPNRDVEQEETFTKTRQQRIQTNLLKSELRATENVLEHLPQIVISLAMLTLKGAETDLLTNAGKAIFFILSFALSVQSIVRGQISLISARKKGQLETEAKFLLAIYEVLAILPRLYAIVLLFSGENLKGQEESGINYVVSFTIFGLVASLHILLSCAAQKLIFKEEKSLFWQALWTFLAPPLFFDWDTLYRQQEQKMTILECWSRTKYCIFIHNALTLLGNVALDRIVGLGMTKIVPGYPDLDNVIKFATLVCIHAILIGLTLLYFKRLHPWARLLNAELTKNQQVPQPRQSKIHPAQANFNTPRQSAGLRNGSHSTGLNHTQGRYKFTL